MCLYNSNPRLLLMLGHRKYFPEGQTFSRNHLPHLFHKWFMERCERNVSRGPPLWVGVGGHGSLSLRHDQFVGVVGGNILNGEHLEKIVGALAGDGSGGGKAKGGGLRIAATLFFHKHVIFLQRIVVLHGRTKKERSDKSILAATKCGDPSWVFPPTSWRGCLDRGSHMLFKVRMITAGGRHVRTVLCCSYASDLCPLPGAVVSCQVLQTSPPHKFPGGHNKDYD